MTPYNANTDKIYLDFGGFYETWHDRLLQDAEAAAFINAYREAYPDDKEAEEWADNFGYGMDELYTAPDRMLEVFNHKWKYDNHAAARHYLTEMLDFVSRVYFNQAQRLAFDLGLKLMGIDYTNDNFQRPDLAVLYPIGQVMFDRVMNWLHAAPERMAELDATIRHMTTPCDGYMPLYTYGQVVRDDGWRVRLTLEMMVSRCCPVNDDAARDLPTDENWFEYAQCNLDCEMGGDFGRIEK